MKNNVENVSECAHDVPLSDAVKAATDLRIAGKEARVVVGHGADHLHYVAERAREKISHEADRLMAATKQVTQPRSSQLLAVGATCGVFLLGAAFGAALNAQLSHLLH